MDNYRVTFLTDFSLKHSSSLSNEYIDSRKMCWIQTEFIEEKKKPKKCLVWILESIATLLNERYMFFFSAIGLYLCLHNSKCTFDCFVHYAKWQKAKMWLQCGPNKTCFILLYDNERAMQWDDQQQKR